MKRNKLKIVVLLFLLVLVGTVALNEYYKRLPKRYFGDGVRSVQEIHDAINGNDNLLLVVSDEQRSYYDINGNCYLNLEYFGSTSEGLPFVGDDFVPFEGECTVKEMGQHRHGLLLFKDSVYIKLYIYIFLQSPYKISFPTVDGYYTMNYYRDRNDGYKYSHVSKLYDDGVCEYYPYNVLETTCQGENIKDAERVYYDFKALLDEIGIAEEELFMYLEWYVQQVDSKVVQGK